MAVREMLAMTDWVIQYAKHDIEIATRACSSSEMHMLRSSVLIPLPVERTHAHYKARDEPASLLRRHVG